MKNTECLVLGRFKGWGVLCLYVLLFLGGGGGVLCLYVLLFLGGGGCLCPLILRGGGGVYTSFHSGGVGVGWFNFKCLFILGEGGRTGPFRCFWAATPFFSFLF